MIYCYGEISVNTDAEILCNICTSVSHLPFIFVNSFDDFIFEIDISNVHIDILVEIINPRSVS